VDVLRWFLVALPDDPAFMAAALGMYTEGGFAYLWGLEGIEEKSGDAAQSWARAVNATLEALEMGFPDILLGYIDEVEGLLRAIRDINEGLQDIACCVDSDPTSGDQYTDTNFDDAGPFPQDLVDAGFLTDVNDTAGWQDYKCLISNAFVDSVIAWLVNMAPYYDSTAKILGGVATIAAFLTAVFGLITGSWVLMFTGIVASAGLVAAVYKALTDLGGLALTILAADVETARPDLVCALYTADGVDAGITAVRAAVDENFNATEAALLKLLFQDWIYKGYYAGRYDQEAVAQQLADKGYTGAYDCDQCGVPVYDFDTTYTFDADTEGWGGDGTISWSADHGVSAHAGSPPGNRVLGTAGSGLWSRLGFGNDEHTIRVELLEFDLCSSTGSSNTYVRILVQGDEKEQITYSQTVRCDAPPKTHKVYSDPAGLGANITWKGGDASIIVIQFAAVYVSGSPGVSYWFDNVRIAGTVIA
jgi:hypothetical protein